MKKEAKATGMWAIYVVSAIVFIYGLVCLKDAYSGYRVSESELEEALTIIGYSVAIDIWSIFSYFIFIAGAGKGYYEARYFWFVFLFPIFGIPFLAIAPDLTLREEIAALRASMSQTAAQPQARPQPAPNYNAQPAQNYNAQPAQTYNAQPAPNYNAPQPAPGYKAQPAPGTPNNASTYSASEVKVTPENAENAVKMCAKFALSFTTDLGMIRYVRKIAKEPEVGEAFVPLLELEPAEMCQRLEELAK